MKEGGLKRVSLMNAKIYDIIYLQLMKAKNCCHFPFPLRSRQENDTN